MALAGHPRWVKLGRTLPHTWSRNRVSSQIAARWRVTLACRVSVSSFLWRRGATVGAAPQDRGVVAGEVGLLRGVVDSGNVGWSSFRCAMCATADGESTASSARLLPVAVRSDECCRTRPRHSRRRLPPGPAPQDLSWREALVPGGHRVQLFKISPAGRSWCVAVGRRCPRATATPEVILLPPGRGEVPRSSA